MTVEAETLLARWVEHHVLRDEELDPSALCPGRPDLVPELQALIARYRAVSGSLGGLPGVTDRAEGAPAGTAAPLPAFEGFRTIERIGTGGMGEVYKLHDLKLDRLVAAKIVRGDGGLASGLAGFLSEARALALFQDRRIVQIHEFRDQAAPPVLIMEYVDGFELGRLAPSLEFHQRARIMKEVCEAVHHAHEVGVQHRDLKPSNIMLAAELRPKILDFGLSASEPTRGHFRGTPNYLAPGAPESLQAIALKALEARPVDRYQSAREMALDLARFLDGRPVTTRPSRYGSVLTARIRPHLEQVEDWLRLKLIHPHEAGRIRSAYRALERRDDDWIGESRVLSYSQILLYLGAFLLLCGSVFYFGAHRYWGDIRGIAEPFLVLALPFVALNAAAHALASRGQKAVAVAFYLAGISLLPLFLLILFHDQHLWVVPRDMPGQLFQNGAVSNRQIQVTVLVALVWTSWLAFRTRTIALSTVFAVLGVLLTFAVLTDFGLRAWFEDQTWDRLALRLLPLVPIYVAAGLGLQAANRTWFGRPLYTAAALLLVVSMELLALNGEQFRYLGIRMAAFQPDRVSDAQLLPTVAAMTLNGMLFYAVAYCAERFGPDLMTTATWVLFSLSPFAIMEPLAYLGESAEYSHAFLWFYLGLAVAIVLLSHRRQRKSFYYAGVINTGFALWLIADQYKWLDRPAWAKVLIVVGLAGLLTGLGLDWRERRHTRPGS
ncbi:MAG: hypothetical protein FIB01_09895 [Gemmatimonadetes bacterium]|nr:hypothetical protein [Gemmatimonadota bacterium]